MKVDLDKLEQVAKAATQGPWQWFGNTKGHSVYLATTHSGRTFVMDFERWGMTQAQPRFQIDHRMVRLGDMGKTEHPMGPKFEVPYRRDFYGIGHPDAAHIAAADPSTVLALVTRIRELEAALTAAGTMLEARADRDFRREAAQSFYAIVEKGMTR